MFDICFFLSLSLPLSRSLSFSLSPRLAFSLQEKKIKLTRRWRHSDRSTLVRRKCPFIVDYFLDLNFVEIVLQIYNWSIDRSKITSRHVLKTNEFFFPLNLSFKRRWRRWFIRLCLTSLVNLFMAFCQQKKNTLFVLDGRIDFLQLIYRRSISILHDWPLTFFRF